MKRGQGGARRDREGINVNRVEEADGMRKWGARRNRKR